jgi:hypothetical protein
MSENIASIIKWHEQTFPDATLEGQIEKFDDEVKEFYEAELLSDEAATELADCFVVGCGMARFSFLFAMNAFSFVFDYLVDEDEFAKKFLSAVENKMQTNRQRKWNKIGNKFQHIEEGK